MADLNRFAIDGLDHAAFGALIKKWARKKIDFPNTIAEFKQQLIDHDIRGIFPTGANELTEINPIWGEVQRLDIRLPPETLIDESEEWLRNGGKYPLPEYYEQIFGCEPKIKDSLWFHNARVGDYTIANCG